MTFGLSRYAVMRQQGRRHRRPFAWTSASKMSFETTLTNGLPEADTKQNVTPPNTCPMLGGG